MHAPDERHVVRDALRVWQQLADPRAAAPALRELEDAGRDRETRLSAGHPGDALAVSHRVRQVLVVELFELRLVVEQVELRRRAVHVEVDQALCFWREMRE